MPWSERQGHSGFSWSWLGAAMATTSLPFRLVVAPGYRYPPTVVAHAAATLQQMFPDRFSVALGSGEALNEHITGEPWPPKEERNARLLECVQIIRRLWAGETVTHRGRVTVVDARLYSLPDRPPNIIGAALTETTAEWMGSWADGLITVTSADLHKLIDAFRRGGGQNKPVIAQAKISWARSEEDAVRGAMEQWSTNVFPSHIGSDLRMPADYDERARDVTEEQLRKAVRVSTDLEQHIAWIRNDVSLGIEELYLHNVNKEQREFIDVFGQEVLPRLRP